MANTFFEMHSSPEKHHEVYEKYLVLSDEEQRKLNVGKSRVYLSVEDIEQIQNAFEITLQTAENLVGGLNKQDERRIMQMGYALEEIKHKLIKDIKAGKKNA